MRDAGIVDEDRDGAKGLLRRIEGARHGGAVGNVGFDRDRLPALLFDLVLEGLEPVRPPRHERERGAILRQRPGELHAETAGRAGHQRHAAFQAEHLGGFHAEAVIHGGRNDME